MQRIQNKSKSKKTQHRTAGLRQRIDQRLMQSQIASTLVEDTRLRTVLITLPGMGLNLIYAIFNGVIGYMEQSAWYGSLAAYYLILCVMRFSAVSYARKIYNGRIPWKKYRRSKKQKKVNKPERRAWRVYRNCGAMLLIMAVALGGAVIILVSGEGGKSYPGLMIYTVATYTFYKLTLAIINMIKARKQKSILLGTLRNINYCDALVSLLSLQTALFAAFGQESEKMIPLMNALTGAGVCLMIWIMGAYMVYRAGKMTGKENKNDTYTCS